MTPDQARALLDGTTPGPWKWRWDTGLVSLFGAKGESVATDLEVQDSDLAAAAPTLAALIAGMREEWGVEERHEYTGKWTWHSTYPDRESARSAVNGMGHFRVVHRYVTPTEGA